jgi:alpha-methylacyl-CoA racemase
MKMLEGINVLDVTYYLPGPYAAMRLAEMGAHVIKVEPPGGDPAKTMSGGVVHQANNKGKEFVTMDLKTEEGKASMIELIKKADVLLESFRPGVMKRLGFDYDTIKALKPDIIYCSMTGYGQNGPLSAVGSHDINYMALSGVLSQLADCEGNPVHPQNTLADYVGALAVSEGILAALVKRFRTGQGAFVNIALTDALLDFQGTHLAYNEQGISDRGIPEIDGTSICYGLYPTKDGRHVALGALEPKFWDNFCEFAKHPEWKQSGFYATGTPEHSEVSEFIASHTWSEWLDISCRTDFCLTPVMRITELFEHPYWQAKGISNNKVKVINSN